MIDHALISKYDILSRLPGLVGQRYANKLWRYHCSARFDNALAECRGQVCIDVGANMGEFTRKMITVAGKMVVFEPDPDTFGALKAATAEFDDVELDGPRGKTLSGGCSPCFRGQEGGNTRHSPSVRVH